MAEKRVLILSYSFSNQTRNMLKKLVVGLDAEKVEIIWEELQPVEELRFPIGTIPSTVWMMFETFFRKRTPIKAVDPTIFRKWDLIILAGPTWSYHPSGPVLSLFDRDGKKVFSEQTVLPLISCRGYWRMHFWGLRALLKKCGTKYVLSPIVFSHPVAEPWRTIGVFLKLAGKTPEASTGWFRKVYPKYGHSREQGEAALLLGKELGRDLISGRDLTEVHFETPVPSSTE